MDKSSGIAERVGHRVVILPLLGAPGTIAVEIEKQTGKKSAPPAARVSCSVKAGPLRPNQRENKNEEVIRGKNGFQLPVVIEHLVT